MDCHLVVTLYKKPSETILLKVLLKRVFRNHYLGFIFFTPTPMICEMKSHTICRK